MPNIASLDCIAVNITPKTNWVFLAVTTDGGMTGWGECSLNRWEPLIVAYAQQFAGDAVGRDIEDVSLVRHFAHSPGGLVVHAVRSGVEQALTDIKAQQLGRPINATLGRLLHSSVPAYANINRGVKVRSPEGFAAAARGASHAGYRIFKLAPFDGVVSEDALTTPIDDRIRQGLDRIHAVRDAIGADGGLLIDCHWRFDEARATALLREVEKARPYWVECPISERPDNHAAIVRLRRHANDLGIKLAGGEMITSVEGAEYMCAGGLYDVLMPDIKYAGGYAAMMAIANTCNAHGLAFSPHNPSGPIAHLASIHLCAVAQSLLWLEHQWGESSMFESLVGGTPAPLQDGAFMVPTGPGLGAMLDQGLARSRPYVALPKAATLDERLG